MAKQLYIETVGCQMNMLDSELVVASLRKLGYEIVDEPAKADTPKRSISAPGFCAT